MNVERVRKEVERSETELAKLLDEKKSFIEKKNGIGAERGSALLALANGDNKQREVIRELEEKMVPVNQDLEGVSLLIVEAESQLSKAKDLLTQAQVAEKQALEAFIFQRENEQCAVEISEIGTRVQRFVTSYIELCEQLAEINLLDFRLTSYQGAGKQAVSEALHYLRMRTGDTATEAGWRALSARGFYGDLVVSSLIQAPGEPKTAVLNPMEVEKARCEQRTRKWKEEFEKGRNEAT